MKNAKFIFVFCAVAALGNAQPYGEAVYAHGNSLLSSGTITSINPGFLMSGFEVTTIPLGYNFNIDRTDAGGAFNGSPWEFQQRYQLFGSSNCLAAPPQINNCAGVSLIESNTIPLTPYVMAGAMDYGCFFANFNAVGGVATQAAYLFPGTTPKAFVTKPLITESVQVPGEYYVVGAYDNTMYILKVNSTGAILAQNSILVSTSVTFSPRAIIESPYTPFDLTVVGPIFNMLGTGTDGFFFQIDNTLTTINTFRTYDVPAVANNNGFTSIKEAQSLSAGGNGFLVGGYAEVNNFTGKAWMLKLDPTGATAYWSTFISGTTDPTAGKIHAVVERYSNFNLIYENYGACAANTGMTVYKLDDFGVPFNTTYGSNDEFVYNVAGNNAGSWPVDMTFLDNGGAADIGLHIFGNQYSFTPNRHYFVEAYFNGVSGCEINTIIGSYTQSLPSITSPAYGASSLLTSCSGFYILQNTISPYQAICGPAASVPGGSNNRSVGISDLSKDDAELGISPNPTDGKIKLTFKAEVNGKAEIMVNNALGQQVKLIHVDVANQNLEMDLNSFGLESGIYFINVECNGKVYKEKIVLSNK